MTDGKGNKIIALNNVPKDDEILGSQMQTNASMLFVSCRGCPVLISGAGCSLMFVFALPLSAAVPGSVRIDVPFVSRAGGADGKTFTTHSRFKASLRAHAFCIAGTAQSWQLCLTALLTVLTSVSVLSRADVGNVRSNPGREGWSLIGHGLDCLAAGRCKGWS